MRWLLLGDVAADRGLTSCNWWWYKTLDVDLICLILFVHRCPVRVLHCPHWWFDKGIGSLSSFSMPKKEIMRVRNSQCLATGLDALNSGASSLWEVSMGLIDLVCMSLYKYVHTDYHHVLSRMVCWPVVIGRYGAWGHSKTFIHIHTDRCLSANGCLCVLVGIVGNECQKSLLEKNNTYNQWTHTMNASPIIVMMCWLAAALCIMSEWKQTDRWIFLPVWSHHSRPAHKQQRTGRFLFYLEFGLINSLCCWLAQIASSFSLYMRLNVTEVRIWNTLQHCNRRQCVNRWSGGKR